MQIKIKLIMNRRSGKAFFTDPNGNRVDIIALLEGVLALDEDGSVPMLIVADDSRHTQMPFDLETARAMLDGQVKGYFSTAGHQRATVYNTSAKGAFPVLGIAQDGTPCLWDNDGKEKSGRPDLTLSMVIETPRSMTDPPAQMGDIQDAW